jgi:hypothetical protein
MQEKQSKNLIRLLLPCMVLTMLSGIGVFLALSSPLVQAQGADHQETWTEGGLGEVRGGEDRHLDASVNSDAVFDPNVDADGDGILNGKEGNELLPGTYGGDAYMNPNLVTLMTKGGKISLKISDGRFRKVHVMPDPDPNQPEKTIDDPDFPYGFISFRIEGLDQDGKEEVQLKILFPQEVGAHAKLYRYQPQEFGRPDHYEAQLGYDIGDGDFWKYDYDKYDYAGAPPPPPSKQSIKLTLKDNNGFYDADIQDQTGYKGAIEGIWGLGEPKSAGKGRCFIQSLPGL